MDAKKKWGIGFLITAAALLLILGGLTAVVDPYFHYHGPLADCPIPMGTSDTRMTESFANLPMMP